MCVAFLLGDYTGSGAHVSEQGIWIGTTVYPADAHLVSEAAMAYYLRYVFASDPGRDSVFFSPVPFDQRAVAAIMREFYDVNAYGVVFNGDSSRKVDLYTEADITVFELREKEARIRLIGSSLKRSYELLANLEAADYVGGAILSFFLQFAIFGQPQLLLLCDIDAIDAECMDLCMHIRYLMNETYSFDVVSSAYQQLVYDHREMTYPYYPPFNIDNEEQLYSLHKLLKSKSPVCNRPPNVRKYLYDAKIEVNDVALQFARLRALRDEKLMALSTVERDRRSQWDVEKELARYTRERRLELEKNYMSQLLALQKSLCE